MARDMRYMRLLTSIQMHHPKALQRATEATFHAIWTDTSNRDDSDRAVMSEETLRSICGAGGLQPADIEVTLASIGEAVVKETLRSSVEEAIELGAFGAPFMVVSKPGLPEGVGGVDGDVPIVFFGSDRFEQMAFTLGLPWVGPDPTRPSCMGKL